MKLSNFEIRTGIGGKDDTDHIFMFYKYWDLFILHIQTFYL